MIGHVIFALISVPQAHAACDFIPGEMNQVLGSVGALDRPFASPGAVVDVSDGCRPAPSRIGATAAEHVVTVVFLPPGGGARSAVVLATDCTPFQPTVPICSALQRGRACCQQVGVLGEGQSGFLRYEREGKPHLRFRFPDTDALFSDAPNDNLTLSGPAIVAVSRTTDALPLDLLADGATCAGRDALVACVDRLFEPDGNCPPATPDSRIAHFVALPPMNDFRGICETPAVCEPNGQALRMTTDLDGNLLVPMDWRGVRVGDGTLAIARLLRGTADVPAFPGESAMLQLPGTVNVRSFSPAGTPLGPVLDLQTPTAGTAAASSGDLVLFGSTDGPQSVLGVFRRHGRCAGGAKAGAACVGDVDCDTGSACIPACVGGTLDGSTCTKDTDCLGGGRCGRLFDFASRAEAQVGPVLLERSQSAASARAVPAGSFRAQAEDPAPLEGLTQSSELTSIVVSEPLVERTLNQDNDTKDWVVQLAARATGEKLLGNGTTGRAVTRVRQQPFRFPAVAVDGNVLAYLESEPAENGEDANGNGRSADAILRVHERDAAGVLHERTTDARAVDAAPVIDGRSFVVSNGRVFYRRSEAGAAARTTVLASVDPTGAPLSDAALPDISADGGYVTFTSTQLLFPSPGSGATDPDIFLRDLRSGTTRLVTTNASGGEAGYDGPYPHHAARVAPGGTDVVFQAWTGPPSGAHILRRRMSQAIPEIVTTPVVPTGYEVYTERLNASRNGRFVCAFGADNVVPYDVNNWDDIVVIDLASGERYLATLRSDGRQYARGGYPTECAVSDDGRIIAFEMVDFANYPGIPPLVDDDSNLFWDIYVHDRSTGRTEVISRPGGGGRPGEQSDGNSFFPTVSSDGRYVAFESDASNLITGDTNTSTDIFVWDRETRVIDRVSVASDGTEADYNSGSAIISADGSAIGFQSEAANLVPGAPDGGYFVHNRLTGVTERVDLTAAGNPMPAQYIRDGTEWVPYAMSGDGNSLVFEGTDGVYVRSPVAASSPFDLYPDGQLDDTVLEVFAAHSGTATTLCPATAAAVVDGMVAFLRPEAPTGGNATCPAGSLNEDQDTDDLVPHLWKGTGAPVSLCHTAEAIALSSSYVAILASDPGGGTPRVAVRAVASADGSCGGWVDLGIPADRVSVCGSVVAFLAVESAAGNLNGDSDTDDRVLVLYDADRHVVVNTRQAATEIVCSNDLVAFRTPEAGQDHTRMNGDGDTLDDVLQAYDISRQDCLVTGTPPAGCLRSSGRSAIPCPSEACDPRLPYRVLGRTVRFLTLEEQESADLTGDGDQADLVLEMLNVPTGDVKVMAHAALGICTTSGIACAGDADCDGGTCFVPPGGCIRDTGLDCDPASGPSECPQGFCQPLPGAPGHGTCQLKESDCASQANCTAGAVCRVTDDSPNQIVAPITAGADTSLTVTSAGRCVETLATACTVSDQCATGSTCDDGACRRVHGTCRQDADCGVGTCRPELVLATAADRDHDEAPDYLDNCPSLSNPDQADLDGDGIGDECELCPPLPDATCVAPAKSHGARLRITDRSVNTFDRLNFRWSQGTVARTDFGDPLATTSWALCVYDAAGTPATALRYAGTVSPGGKCGKGPCWTVDAKAAKYANTNPSNGVRKLTLRAKTGLGGKLEVDARGAALHPPAPASLLGVTVKVQMRSSSGGCFEGTFPVASTNDGVVYSAVSQ